MKTIKELKTLNLSSYFFKEMINVLDIEPEYFMINYFKGCKDGSILFNLCYSDENGVFPHIVFNNIECIKNFHGNSSIYSYLIFCKRDKNKDMLNNHFKIIDQIKEDILSLIDEDDSFNLGDEEDSFNLGDDFLRFKLMNFY